MATNWQALAKVYPFLADEASCSEQLDVDVLSLFSIVRSKLSVPFVARIAINRGHGLDVRICFFTPSVLM